MTDYHDMEYEELKQIHRDIGQLLQDKKEEALEKIRSTMENLGFNVSDLTLKPAKKNGAKKYVDPDNPENTYGGKGPKPPWLVEALEGGAKLQDFLVH